MNYIESFLATLTTDISSRTLFSSFSTHVAFLRLQAGIHTYHRHFSAKVLKGNEERDNLREFFMAQGYVFMRMDSGAAGVLTIDGVIQSVVLVTHLVNDVMVSMASDLACLDAFDAHFKAQYPTFGAYVITHTGLDDKGRFTTSEAHLVEEQSSRAHQAFYPNMKLPLQAYYDKFMQSKENILVLIGPPGTGKSTFLRSLIVSGNFKTYLTYSKQVIESDALITRFYDSTARILAFEDVDAYLAKRENGNVLMTTYLNASEGIVQRHDKKIIFSTNLNSIDRIDSALLRRGRCFDVIKFDLLTVPQAREVEKTLSMPEQDLSSKQHWSLSEVLNPVQDYLQCVSRTGNTIGFSQ